MNDPRTPQAAGTPPTPAQAVLNPPRQVLGLWLCLTGLLSATAAPSEAASPRQIAPSTLARELDSTRITPAPQPPEAAPQPNAALPPLTLNDAVRQAVARHPAIADAVATLNQQLNGVSVARAGYYPQVRVGVGAGRNNGITSLGGRTTPTMATASVSQMLYDFGKVSGTVVQARAQVQRQQALLLLQIDDVAQQTADAVVMAHRYQVLVDLAQEQVEAVQKVLELARLRADAGISTKADPIQAQSRVDAARANLLQMRSQLAQWRERLSTLLGAGAVPARMAPLPEDLADALRPEAPLDASLMPAVLAAQADRRIASAQIEVAKAQRFPTLSLDATVDKAISGINPSTFERNGLSHSIMLNLSGVLYQGGALNAQVRAARAAEEAAQMRIETARLTASDQARSFREQLLGAQARLGVLAERKRSITEVRELYREQYTLGTRSILDLLNAEQEIYQAAADQETVLHELWQSRIGYIGATGQGRALYQLNNTVVQGMELLP